MEDEGFKEESQPDLIEPTKPADQIHLIISQPPEETSIINISPINSVLVLSLPSLPHGIDTVNF